MYVCAAFFGKVKEGGVGGAGQASKLSDMKCVCCCGVKLRSPLLLHALGISAVGERMRFGHMHVKPKKSGEISATRKATL
jgi:hypothetical protein